MTRPGWTPLRTRARRKTDGHWRHDASGWEVRHCGHPTANWPYYLIDPRRPWTCTVTHNGLGFQYLAWAITAVEMIFDGRVEVTTKRCGPRTQRVVRPGTGAVGFDDPAREAWTDFGPARLA